MAINTPSPVPQARPGQIQSLGANKYSKRLEAYRGAKRDYVNRLFKGMLKQPNPNPYQRGPENSQITTQLISQPKSMGMAEAAQRRAQNKVRKING